MANVTAVIVPAKALKDGRHKVRIAVSHNGQTRYIVTDIILDSEKQLKNGSIVRRADCEILNTRLDGLIKKVRKMIYSIESVSYLSCSELISVIKNTNDKKQLTLQMLYEEFLNSMNICVRSKHVHDTQWRAICQIVNKNMLAQHLTPGTARLLLNELGKKDLSPSTVNLYYNLFKRVVSFGVRAGIVHFERDIFLGIRLPKLEIRDCWLTVDEIKLIRDYDCKSRYRKRIRDLFMLSYYLGGMNIADMRRINFNETNGQISYLRQKTKNRNTKKEYVQFKIQNEALALIEKLIDEKGFLKDIPLDSKGNVQPMFQPHLSSIREDLGLKRLIFYSARKSFSQHAFELGINTKVIDYILGHSMSSRSDGNSSSLIHYVAVTPQMATEAIRKVLDNLK